MLPENLINNYLTNFFCFGKYLFMLIDVKTICFYFTKYMFILNDVQNILQVGKWAQDKTSRVSHQDLQVDKGQGQEEVGGGTVKRPPGETILGA